MSFTPPPPTFSPDPDSAQQTPTLTTPSAADKGRQLWRIGTLTYSSSALALLFFWLLWGDFAWQMRERSASPTLQVILKQYQASDVIIGLFLASLPAALTVMIAPVVSYYSDRYRSPRGRRIPFLLVSTPIAAGGLFLLAAAPWLGQLLHTQLGASSPGANTCALIAIGLAWTIFETAAIAGNALFGALINDVVPREMLGRFFGLFRACSLLVGILFNKMIFAQAETYYVEIFIGVGLLFCIGFMMMCWQVREGEYPPPPPPDPRVPVGFKSACRVYWRECFTHPYYRTIFIVLTLANLAGLPLALYNLYYADKVGMSRQTYGDLTALTYVISLVLAYFLGWLADRYHPLPLGILMLVLNCIVGICGGLWASDATSFGVALVLQGVLGGAYMTTTASLPSRLFPHSRFAQFSSAVALITGVASVIFPTILGSILDYTGRNYQQTFFWGASISALALVGMIYVYIQWSRLGGHRNYQPPAI